jgi:alginate O-acetyltransferase complex protein AlgI
MLFNSLSFGLFLPVVFILYWSIAGKSHRRQNILLLAASYFFYSCWDVRFLLLLVFSTLLDYCTGILMVADRTKGRSTLWLWLSISINLGFLGVFKYFNFFAQSFADALGSLGFAVNPVVLQVMLPVGISFYTFHGLSYVIDIYKGRIEPTRNFVDYSLFVCYFPLLVAGPIERATHLLPQLQRPRIFSYAKATEGLRQILWGLFKKIVVADQCAEYVHLFFSDPGAYSGSALFLGMVFFAFQIYGDFSGYTDIALGTSKLFGIELLQNFRFPYFSRSMSEFWKRWHISLSTWFQDYLFMPLAIQLRGLRKWGVAIAVFLTFMVSGIWHGANWTFIVWGAFHGLVLAAEQGVRTVFPRLLPEATAPWRLRQLPLIGGTFLMVSLALVVFRAENLGAAMDYIAHMASPSLFQIPAFPGKMGALTAFLLVIFMLAVEWWGRNGAFALEQFGERWRWPFRYAAYYTLIFAIFFCAGNEKQFIYFQF